MLNPWVNKRGIALFLVLTMFLTVVILANAILTLMLSQSRLTHHQVSRIQAYYASMAGINYAYDKLRSGSWVAGTDCDTGCALPTDTSFPLNITATIHPVSITIKTPQSTNSGGPCYNPPGNCNCITVETIYTSQLSP